MQLSDAEKLILIMLSEIHEKLGIKNGVEPAFIKEAIYSGNTWGLTWQYPGIFDAKETRDEVRNEAADILDMWTLLEAAYKKLSAADKKRVKTEAAPFGDEVKFRGFDGNNESEYINVSGFLIEQLGRWSNFKGRDLNSHMPSLGGYRRTLSAYEPIRKSLGLGGGSLGADQIVTILKERMHPSHR